VIGLPSSSALLGLAETLDVLITLTPPLAGNQAGPKRRDGAPPAPDRLYRAARRRVGAPLAAAAAGELRRRVCGGSRVILTTGLVTARVPRGETDGPPGVAVLARALVLGLGADVLVLTEAPVVAGLRRTIEALAFSGTDGGKWPSRVRVRSFPTDPAAAALDADRLLRSGPSALVSIEKLGPNARGVIHTMRGEDVTRSQARTDLLFPAACRRGILTIGIGDRGNEIGLGGLRMRPTRCACGCGGGIACGVRADIPVVAFNSNWGAHAITAALAASLGNSRLLHRPAGEGRMLRALVRAGGVDGVTGRRDPTVDGGPLALQTAMVGMLHALLGSLLRP